MNKMKKILVCALAVLLVLALTACSGKCAYCGKQIQGKAYESNEKNYCDKDCADDAAFKELLTDQMPEE